MQACVFVGSAAQVSDVIRGPLCRFVYFVSSKLNTPDTAITELLATCRGWRAGNGLTLGQLSMYCCWPDVGPKTSHKRF